MIPSLSGTSAVQTTRIRTGPVSRWGARARRTLVADRSQRRVRTYFTSTLRSPV